jgi:hypothetical protein
VKRPEICACLAWALSAEREGESQLSKRPSEEIALEVSMSKVKSIGVCGRSADHQVQFLMSGPRGDVGARQEMRYSHRPADLNLMSAIYYLAV